MYSLMDDILDVKPKKLAASAIQVIISLFIDLVASSSLPRHAEKASRNFIARLKCVSPSSCDAPPLKILPDKVLALLHIMNPCCAVIGPCCL